MKLFLLLTLFSGLTACKIFQDKSDLDFTPKGGDLKTTSSNKIEFSEIKNAILIPHCLKCHSGYANYNTVFNQRNSILSEVLSNRMPKNKDPLKRELKELLQKWIDQGAIYENKIKSVDQVLAPGLSDKLKKLAKEHQGFHPVLDKEKVVKLKESGTTYNYPIDGERTATLSYNISRTYKSLIRIDFIENTCGHFKPQTCLIALKFKNYMKAATWSKHPEKSKIGKIILEKEDENNLEEVAEDDFIMQGIGRIEPNLDFGLKNYLICEDWSWTEGEELKVNSWVSENMTENPETLATENRVNGAAYNLSLKPYNKNIYSVGDAQFYEASFERNTDDFLIGEAGGIYYEKNGQQCLISYKFDLPMLVVAARNAEADFRENFNFKPYIQGQDNTFHPKLDLFINDLIEDLNSEGDFE